MQKMQEKGYMCGHMDATLYGILWEWDRNRCDIKKNAE